MNTPVTTTQQKILKPHRYTNNESNPGASQPSLRRSELALAVSAVLNQNQGELDNRQKLNQINSLVSSASSEELSHLVDSLPDNAIKQWIKEIQSNALPSSGLSADQRQEFFALLGRELTPDQASRWQSIMPESLKAEFANAVAKLGTTSQLNTSSDKNSTSDAQESLFLLSKSTDALSWQNSVSQKSTAQDKSTEQSFANQHQSRSFTAQQPAPRETSSPNYAEKLAFNDAIDTIAPDVTDNVKQQLKDAYTKVKAEIAAVGTAGNDPKALAIAIQETNNLFREHGLGNLLPADRKGRISFVYTAENLPRELNLRSRKGPNDTSYGESGWSASVSLSGMPNSLLKAKAESQLAAPLALAQQVRSEQFDTERGFSPTQNIDDAVMDLEQTLFNGDAADTDLVFSKMLAIDEQVVAEGGTKRTAVYYGETYVNKDLLRFTEDISGLPVVGSGYINTRHLNDEQLVEAAEQHVIDVLSDQLDDRGTADLDTATRAINALNPDGTEQENQMLVNQYMKVQRSIQLVSRNPELESNVLNNLLELDSLFRKAGLPTVLPTPSRNGGIGIRFNSSNLPTELKYLRNRKQSNEAEFGEPDWYVNVPVSELSPERLVEYAKSQLAILPSMAAKAGLSQIDQFEGHAVTHTADIQAMMDSAQPIPAGTDTTGEMVLGDLLQKFDKESSAPESKHDYWRLADTSYEVASSLLTDSAKGMTQEEMNEVNTWINAETLEDLGFYNRIEVTDHNDEESWESLGVYGNFGQAKYDFSTAWLGSSKEQRLDYLGLDKTRWSQAQPYISTGINADTQARNIERAEFGLDDVFKIVIAGTFAYASGGAASGALASMFSSSVAAGTMSAATATYLSAAAGAAAAGFSSTLIMTNGDVEEALKSGLMGALTGGLTKYASTLQGAAKPVALAIINGIQSELSGQDFQDGVLKSVTQSFGEDVSARLAPHMPEFIAGFAGKATEVAIRTGGDRELMQQELEQYVINFSTGQATAKLTAVMGEDYKFVASSLGELADVVIRSKGDMSKVREYLSSDQFYQSLGNNLGAQVTASFGGKEKFSAVLYGKITNIVIASGGDINEITNNMDGLALSVVGEWAGDKLTSQLSGHLGETEGGLAESLGNLTNVAIASNWDANAIATYMNGPLVAALGKEAAGLIPERFGGAGEFLGRALERLTQSYSVNQGDMDAVAKDMAEFILDETINFADQVEANKPLSLGDTSPQVEKVQKQLQEYGFLDASHVTGTFDAATADAVSRFQQDQMGHLETELSTHTSIPLRRMINDQITAVKAEHDAGKVDVITRMLLENPYTSPKAVTESDATNTAEPVDLTSNWENASLDNLSVGSTGPGVARLQHLLTDQGYEPGAVDGIFGDTTAEALGRFQQDQLVLIQNKLSDVSSNTQPALYGLLNQLGGDLVVERSSGTTGALTTELLKTPLTSEILDHPGLNGEQVEGGLMQTNFIGDWFYGRADLSLEELVETLGDRSPNNATNDMVEAIDNSSSEDIEKWGVRIGEIVPAENRVKLFELLTRNLDGNRLTLFHNSMNRQNQNDHVTVVNRTGDDQLVAKLDAARGINTAVDASPDKLINLPSEEDVLSAFEDLKNYPEFKELQARSLYGEIKLEITTGETKHLDGTMYINLDYFNKAYQTERMPDDYMDGYVDGTDAYDERFNDYPDYAQYSVHRILFHEAFHATEPPPPVAYEMNAGPYEKSAIAATNEFMSKYFNDVGRRVNGHDVNIDLRDDRIDSPIILLR